MFTGVTLPPSQGKSCSCSVAKQCCFCCRALFCAGRTVEAVKCTCVCLYYYIYISCLQLCQGERHLMLRPVKGSLVAPWGDAEHNAGHKVADQTMVIFVMGEKIKQAGEISMELLDKDCLCGKFDFSRMISRFSALRAPARNYSYLWYLLTFPTGKPLCIQ